MYTAQPIVSSNVGHVGRSIRHVYQYCLEMTDRKQKSYFFIILKISLFKCFCEGVYNYDIAWNGCDLRWALSPGGFYSYKAISSILKMVLKHKANDCGTARWFRYGLVNHLVVFTNFRQMYLTNWAGWRCRLNISLFMLIAKIRLHTLRHFNTRRVSLPTGVNHLVVSTLIAPLTVI